MYQTSEAKRAAQIKAYIDLYAGVDNPNLRDGPVVSTDCEKWITEDQFNLLKQGSEDLNAISYLKSLPNVTKEEAIKASNANGNSGNENGNSNSGTNSGNAQSNSTSNSNSQNSQQNTNPVNNNPSKGSPNVGSSSVALASQAATAADDASEDSADESDEGGDAYEITEKPATKEINTNTIILAIAAVLIVGGIF